MVYANDPAREDQIRAELRDHLELKIGELEERGLAREDAVFKALESHGHPRVVGYGLRRWRWFDVRSHGTARGFIAIGPRAVGVFAFGGATLGIFSCGGLSAGLFSLGGLALSLLVAWGGFAASLGLAYGGGALGLIAIGGMTCGVVAYGGSAVGLLAMGEGIKYTLYTTENAPEALRNLAEIVKIDRTDWFIINICLLCILMTVLAVGTWMQQRELLRLRRADPGLAE